MPLTIPESMNKEHEELHRELFRATEMTGKIGKAAINVAELFHSHMERENEFVMPVIGIMRELAEGKTSLDYRRALELCDQLKKEYRRMLSEHADILKALNELEKAARSANRPDMMEMTERLKVHALVEEDLTYPAVLITGELLKGRIKTSKKKTR